MDTGADENRRTRLIHSVKTRVAEFLEQEIAIPVENAEPVLHDVRRLDLRDMTSILSVEGDFRLLIAFSFDRSLIGKIFEVYTEGLGIGEDEHELMLESTAAEVINIIVGNAMADVQTPGTAIAIAISPPVVMGDARKITRHEGAQFCTVDITTPNGVMSIHFVGPKEWFDRELNYTGME